MTVRPRNDRKGQFATTNYSVTSIVSLAYVACHLCTLRYCKPKIWLTQWVFCLILAKTCVRLFLSVFTDTVILITRFHVRNAFIAFGLTLISRAMGRHAHCRSVDFTIEIVQIVVIAAAIIIPVRYFLVQPFVVRGASMEPTFVDREYLLVDEISYRFHEPTRGEVVVFRYPLDPSEFFIKRVVGLPGDTVDIRNGKVIVTNDEHQDGVVLDELYLGPGGHSGLETHAVLNPNEYFLLGDNRSASLDSRNFGPVKRNSLLGEYGCVDGRSNALASLMLEIQSITL